MQFREYGADRPETIMLLHGGGLSWWNYRKEAELLMRDYHVILPILDGHAGSDCPFTSIGDNAARVISYIDDCLGGSVLLLGGLSLGGQVLLEMLSRRKGLCRLALVESAMVIPSPVTRALIGPAFGSSYGLIKNERFARLQFRSLHMEDSLFDDYYRDTCAVSRQDMIAFMKANTAYALNPSAADCGASIRLYIGEKETRGIRRSYEALLKALPGSRGTILKGLYHGEFSLNHPQDYVHQVREILREQPGHASSKKEERL